MWHGAIVADRELRFDTFHRDGQDVGARRPRQWPDIPNNCAMELLDWAGTRP
jgi:hypothetical protein